VESIAYSGAFPVARRGAHFIRNFSFLLFFGYLLVMGWKTSLAGSKWRGLRIVRRLFAVPVYWPPEINPRQAQRFWDYRPTLVFLHDGCTNMMGIALGIKLDEDISFLDVCSVIYMF